MEEPGGRWTPEQRAAQADRMRQRMQQPEVRKQSAKRRAQLNRERVGTPEGEAVKVAISRAKKGKPWTPAMRAAQDASNVKRGASISATWTPERRAALREKNKTRVWTPEMRAKKAEQSARWWAENIKDVPVTERYFAALLEYAEVEFEPQVQFGQYVVDFYLPASNSVVEIDGDWPWHRDKEREARRDAYLLDAGVAFVNHVPTTILGVFGS